jgi:hypothetical protein
VIALHSPVKVPETGLSMCRPEKGQQIDAIDPEQFILSSPLCGGNLTNTDIFAYFGAKSAAFSLQSRLCGGEIEIRTFGTFSKR